MGYGEWESPITLDVVTPKEGTEIATAEIDRVTGTLFWRSKKPSGQYVVCTGDSASSATEWTPEGYSVQTRVHEYGGGDYFAHNNILYFINKEDQCIYKQGSPKEEPKLVTEKFGNAEVRYAEGHINTFTNMIICVREDHRNLKQGEECTNTIVAINLVNGQQSVLVEGANFYKSVDTYDNQIIFTSWNHPNMPWDDTQLNVGELVLKDNVPSVINLKTVHTGSSHLQGRFINKEQYLYLCDKTDFWNVWKSTDDKEPWFKSENEPGYPFGWYFGHPGYDIADGRGIVIGATSRDGSRNLLLVDIDNPQTILKDIGNLVREKGYNFGTFSNVLCHGDYVYALGLDDPANPLTLLRVSLADNSVFIYNEEILDDEVKICISYPEPIEFPTTDENMKAYGYFYKPKNPRFTESGDEKPPLLMKVHGGPTGSTTRNLDMKIQYFTSRGFAVFDIDYRGSTGYGRAFRRALYHKWGVVDQEDCISAADYLVKEGKVDGNRLAISGGSAGGYTTMAMMVFQKRFHAGVSYYGISDLLNLTKDTHKFESNYPTKVLGKLPEEEKIYEERSPFYHADQLKPPSAIGFFQGADDPVCPPPQSLKLYEAAVKQGVATFYVEYEEEAHGFKKAENIQRCVSNEIYFYSKIFGFKLFDETPCLPDIVNL